MKINFGKITPGTKYLLGGALLLASTLGALSQASAQTIATPPTSDTIAAPAGNVPYLEGHAFGTQGYICLPAPAGSPTAAAWNSNNARPEATLFTTFFGQQIQIITHFLSKDAAPIPGVAPDPLPFGSATWQSSLDSSKVWAQKVKSVGGGSEPSCPNTGSIACLLLQSIGNQAGPTGGKILARATFVQRLNTKGGLAPVDGCVNASDVGNQVLVPYTADYFFYRKAE